MRDNLGKLKKSLEKRKLSEDDWHCIVKLLSAEGKSTCRSDLHGTSKEKFEKLLNSFLKIFDGVPEMKTSQEIIDNLYYTYVVDS